MSFCKDFEIFPNYMGKYKLYSIFSSLLRIQVYILILGDYGWISIKKRKYYKPKFLCRGFGAYCVWTGLFWLKQSLITCLVYGIFRII